MAIRAVLFDWDGTLVRNDSEALYSPAAAVAHYGRTRLGLAIRDDDVERAFQAVSPKYRPGETRSSPHIDDLVAAAFSWLGWAVGTSDVDACSRLFFDAATTAIVAYDDARAILSSLRFRGCLLGVVSNTIFPARLMQVRVNELGLAGYLDTFVCSADVGLAKPHSAPFQRALQALAVDPHEAIYVGDKVETDIAGARAAGMRAILLERSGRARDAAGYLVVERLSALNGILGEGMLGQD